MTDVDDITTARRWIILGCSLLAALTTLTTVLVLVGSWLADVVHLALDPRVEIDA